METYFYTILYYTIHFILFWIYIKFWPLLYWSKKHSLCISLTLSFAVIFFLRGSLHWAVKFILLLYKNNGSLGHFMYCCSILGCREQSTFLSEHHTADVYGQRLGHIVHQDWVGGGVVGTLRVWLVFKTLTRGWIALDMSRRPSDLCSDTMHFSASVIH